LVELTRDHWLLHAVVHLDHDALPSRDPPRTAAGSAGSLSGWYSISRAARSPTTTAIAKIAPPKTCVASMWAPEASAPIPTAIGGSSTMTTLTTNSGRRRAAWLVRPCPSRVDTSASAARYCHARGLPGRNGERASAIAGSAHSAHTASVAAMK